MKRPSPSRQRPNLLPINIPPVEPIARTSVGNEVGPKILDLPPLADAVPQIARAGSSSLWRTVRRRRRIRRSAHGQSIGYRYGRGPRKDPSFRVELACGIRGGATLVPRRQMTESKEEAEPDETVPVPIP